MRFIKPTRAINSGLQFLSTPSCLEEVSVINFTLSECSAVT